MDIDSANPNFPATPQVYYTIGSTALNIPISQFLTDSDCVLKGINLKFSIATIDLSNGNVLSYLPLPTYVTAIQNSGGLSGGQISIQSSDYTILSTNFYISVEGTF